jgi:hypothetical protein
MKDILAPIQSQILKQVNTSQTQYLDLYAKYFAKALNPEKISMTEIDSTGFTIVYYENSNLNEVRATFPSRILHPSQVDQALFSMAKEAIDALDVKADKSYISPGSEIPTLLQSINWKLFFLVVGLILGLLKIRFTKNPSPLSSWIKESLSGDEGMDRMFLGILILHISESAFTFGICKFWGGLDIYETLLYMLLTLIGGIFVVKGCAQRSSQIQRSIKKKVV